MRLSKRANRSSSFVFAQAITVVFSSVLFVNLVAWSAGFYGFDLGYETARAEYRVPSPEAEIIFPVASTRAYARLSTEYSRVAFLAFLLLGLSITGLIVKIEWVATATTVIGIPCAVLILKDLWFFLSLKDPSLNAFLDLPFNALLMQSVNYDWVCIICSSVIILSEATLAVESLRIRKKS